MKPSTIRTGHALRSAIAHGDQCQTSCIAPRTSRAPFKGALVPGSGAKALEDHLIPMPGRPGALLRRAHGPGQERQAENVTGNPGRRGRQLVDPIGDEMRPGAERMAQMQHALPLRGRRARPVGFLIAAFGDDAAGKPGRQFAQCQHLVRVERHADDGSAIGGEHLRHPRHQFAVAVEMALHFDHQRDPACDQRAEAGERHHPLGGILEPYGLEFGCGHAEQGAAAFGEAPQRIVMMHHGFAIGGELDVAFDATIGVDRGLSRARHVFDDAARAVVQAAMGHRSRRQPVGGPPPRPPYETSNIPSTSTAASAGSEATPTVVRAWRPLSPKAATIRSDAPLSTFGPSTKSGAELTKPPSRTTRTTLSRSPSAALTCARRLMAQPRAAALPCSIVTPAPSLPLAINLPSTPRQTWPDTNSKFPLRTKGT